ncbi:MAG: AraC family transcriptional regulator [Ferruginibacter sp.]
MKPKLLKVALKPQHSFSVRHDAVPHFFKELHFHPEIELVHIHKGSGTQFLGNHIQHFKPGDMIMVGSDIPHLWKCDDAYFKEGSKLKAEATVVHFLPEAFGSDFFLLPENTALYKLFTKAKQGLTIHQKTKDEVSNLLAELLKSDGSKKIILLLEILSLLAESKHIKTINNKDALLIQTEKKTHRMNQILQYLLNNFQNNIILKDISGVANLSPNAFCRYFKLRTNKPYTSFLMEMRINHACKLLAETQKPVSDICYESGFNNFSNFNRYFKQLTQYTPLQYRNNYF